VLAERIDHVGGVARRGVGLAAVDERLELAVDLLLEAVAQFVDVVLERLDLRDVVVVLKVLDEEHHGAEHLGALVVLTQALHRAQLRNAVGEHLQALQRRDRRGQIALGVVELHDVAADLRHHRLVRLGLGADVAHFAKQLRNALLRRLQVHAPSSAADVCSRTAPRMSASRRAL
jgi:hypothetical protein